MLLKLGVMLLGVAATLYISCCLLLLWGQTKLIFLPDSYIKWSFSGWSDYAPRTLRIAIELASKHPDVAGLITEGTFTSVKDLASLLPGLKIFPLSWLVTQRFDSITKIKSLQTPILILHGAGDRTIPPLMAKELYAAAPEPKYLAIFAEAGHNNLPELDLQQYLLTLQEFIQSVSNPTK